MNAPVPAGPGIDPRRAFWWSALLLSLLGVLWALGNPLAAAPDEPTHIAKAGGVVRGQLVGGPLPQGGHAVALPELYGELALWNDCFAFLPNTPASCEHPSAAGHDEVTAVRTTAGLYNPLYYLLVGAPTLLPPSLAALYLVRVLSAVLCAVVLALGIRSAAELRAPAWVLGGVVAATVPMVIFLASTVNPSALEVCAGLSLWVTLLAVVRYPDPALVGRRMMRAGVLVVLLVNAKASSPLYLAIIVLAVVALAPWRTVREIVLDRRAWPGLALGTAGAAAAVAWIAAVGTVAASDEPRFPEYTLHTSLDLVLRRTSVYMVNMLGQFGTQDTNLPLWAYVLLGSLILGLAGVALAIGTRRERAVLVATALLVVALPVVLQLPQATVLGLPWQGRYGLPVGLGVPVMAGFVLASRRDLLPEHLAVRVVALVGMVAAAVQVVAFWTNVRRYAVGIDWPYFTVHPDAWSPPVPVWALLVAVTAVCAAASTLLRWSLDPSRPVARDRELVVR